MKAIITDLDQTLLRSDKSISTYSLDVLKKCKAQGIRLMAASARPLRDIGQYHGLVGFDAVTPENAEAACDALRARGVKTVIITLGEHGAFVKNDDLCILVPPFPVKAVDSTGAGDCFNGALAAALAEDMDHLSAIRYANAAAAISVTGRGSAASMPTRAQVEEFLK